MSKTPSLERLPISSAIKWIIEKTSESMTRTEAKQSFYWALRGGFVPARADIEDSDGNIIERNQSIPKKAWQRISIEGFLERWADRRIIEKSSKGSNTFNKKYYVNILIEIKELEAWLFPKQNGAKITDETRCYEWLENNKKCLAKKGKEAFFSECKVVIEKPNCSRRAFDRAWARIDQKYPTLRISASGRKQKSGQ